MNQDDTVIVVRPVSGTLNSRRCKHTIHLGNENVSIVPQGLDIRGLRMDFPEGLQEVRVLLGGYKIAVFTKEMKEDMETFPIYLTLSKYQTCLLELVYSTEWLEEREEEEMVDEYIDCVEYGDDDVEVFDGEEYHIGKVVIGRNRVLTGGKIKVITKEVDVVFPEIRIMVGKNQHESDRAEVAVRERIDLATLDDEYKNRLLKRYNMVVNEDEKVGYVKNVVYYTQNMGGLRYCFH